MKHRRMTVTMEDGLQIDFFKEGKQVKFVMFNGGCINENDVDEDSIHAVVGEPLSFDYYYGYGSRDHVKTDTPVKEIVYPKTKKSGST